MNHEILLGQTRDGEIVTVEIALRPAQLRTTGQTTSHEPIPDGALELSIVGTEYPGTKAGRHGDIISGGQNLDTARKVKPSDRWTAADLKRLCDIWDRWHLNGMSAGCVHQTEIVYEDSPYGRRVDLDATTAANDCPQGYRYGSAWLFDALPADVLDDVRRFQRRLGVVGYRLEDGES
jgi:hypothetical protein